MKAAILTTIALAMMIFSASAQQCIYAHCGRQLINACDPRCCDLPLSCVRGGPVRPIPPHFSPWTHPPSGPGPHGGIGIK